MTRGRGEEDEKSVNNSNSRGDGQGRFVEQMAEKQRKREATAPVDMFSSEKEALLDLSCLGAPAMVEEPEAPRPPFFFIAEGEPAAAAVDFFGDPGETGAADDMETLK